MAESCVWQKQQTVFFILDDKLYCCLASYDSDHPVEYVLAQQQTKSLIEPINNLNLRTSRQCVL